MKMLFRISLITLWLMSAMACGGSSSSSTKAEATPIDTGTNETKPNTDPKENAPTEEEQDPVDEEEPPPSGNIPAPTEEATLSACAADLFTRWQTNTTVIPTELVTLTEAHGLTLQSTTIQNQRTLDVTFTSDNLTDRKSTRLNSSHVASSYAVFCLK